ncbi:putative endothelial lipase [Melitaea cinxia]|uniref:putative endothelial lipase n=1 Tax=Melitaea cinxia TaxID=113334 RepID=UPI001E270C1B|nr:putative endothelial lipase [Melitaea cinxia]
MELKRLCEDAAKIDWSSVRSASGVNDKITVFDFFLTHLLMPYIPYVLSIFQLQGPQLTSKQDQKNRVKVKYTTNSRIGKQFGKTLLILSKNGLNLKKVHLIGFSLGAQLSGYAGREVQAEGKIIGRLTSSHLKFIFSLKLQIRITGLDPAGPLFDGVVSLRALSASDASFVDIVHTNPGRLGIDSSLGTVDFWPNCESRVQPGCEIKGVRGVPNRNICSHNRCWMYFIGAIESPAAFKATFAEDCLSWKAGVRTNKTVYLGDDINLKARGNFYFETNSAPPFGFKKKDYT